MAKWTVEIEYTLKRELTIFAPNEEEAGDKAFDIVSGWQNVQDVTVVDIAEDDE